MVLRRDGPKFSLRCPGQFTSPTADGLVQRVLSRGPARIRGAGLFIKSDDGHSPSACIGRLFEMFAKQVLEVAELPEPEMTCETHNRRSGHAALARYGCCRAEGDELGLIENSAHDTLELPREYDFPLGDHRLELIQI
nr:hypothetical protein [Sinorhizobium medicae]